MALDIIRVQIHDEHYCEIKKYSGSNGEYYSVNDVNYDIRFPIEWVFQHPENDLFGPETCYDCFVNGYCNGVFIGYCANCAYLCDYKRGNGLIGGIEQEHAHLDTKNSIWNLYLQLVSSVNEIGDRQLQLDYDYKVYFSQPTTDDDITVTYNDSVVYSYSYDEDDVTVSFFSYYSDDDDDNDMFMDIDSIS